MPTKSKPRQSMCALLPYTCNSRLTDVLTSCLTVGRKWTDGEDLSKLSFTTVPMGLPGLETRLPLVYSAGVQAGRIDLNTYVVRLYSHCKSCKLMVAGWRVGSRQCVPPIQQNSMVCILEKVSLPSAAMRILLSGIRLPRQSSRMMPFMTRWCVSASAGGTGSAV